jgi:Cu2+-exporting ATPase
VSRRRCHPVSRPVFHIVNEQPRRLRLRGRVIAHPCLDLSYLQALLAALSGVTVARINPGARCVIVDYDGQADTRVRVMDALANIPADAYRDDAVREQPPDAFRAITTSVLALATPLMPLPLRLLVGWTLALPTMAKGVTTLFQDGVRVEVLDGSAKLLSLLRGDFFTANAIGALLDWGEYVEATSEQRSNELLKRLLTPQTDQVWIHRDGVETKVPLGEVQIGDIVICGPGELIPVDGRVRDGEAAVDQSSLTGESLPVPVAEGSPVMSGSVIHEGHIRIHAEQVGAETSMARINRFLETALRGRSTGEQNSAKLADKLVPLTFATGLGVFALTRDLARAASVLTVDYSCAIKLSNPVAVRSNLYAASRAGVLFKGAQALEDLNRVDTLVFDKTGTLTTGDMRVADLIPLGELSDEGLLSLAAGAEEHYDHPVARAVVAAAAARALALPPISQVDFVVAHGVSAYVNDARVLVGSRHFLEDDEGVDCTAADAVLPDLYSAGKSVLFVARGGRLAGLIALVDQIRPEATQALAELKRLGIDRTVVLTGDHREAGRALARAMPDIDEVRWELKPEDKAAAVKDLKAQGRCVGFLGDGVNDAPALVSADVGISMPNGADLAREAAQVVLMRPELDGLVTAVATARRTQAVLRRSALAAFGINTATMGFAVGGLLPPVAAATIHNGSTVGILGYAAAGGGRLPGGRARRVAAETPPSPLPVPAPPQTPGLAQAAGQPDHSQGAARGRRGKWTTSIKAGAGKRQTTEAEMQDADFA